MRKMVLQFRSCFACFFPLLTFFEGRIAGAEHEKESG